MDRFVVKRSAEEPGGDGKKPRLEEEAGGLPHPSQPSQEIRAQGLSLEYRLLFGRAEADAIFQQLEKEVEYFEDIKMVRTT
ncbi:DNA oxidative demethylase ALKBH2 isoform 3 [Gallus gallus]|uniref:AlkB homolog 2, alpha-ketoglutarate dependent dioxygenase n=1 Tax=Gallus gallus TaxID=9031 RepID=A0A8V0ZJW6_CHICK|nr:DNA oxidative demethylase ALKBH2 isoform 3 [Gallus gallus]|eukprot:NP_001264428.1 DNA oxidative demethylase ALKBH2 isoform 3 [Gallus gallus]